MTAPEEDPPVMSISPTGAYKAIEEMRAQLADLTERVRVLELAGAPDDGG